MKFLLSDEKKISASDYEERKNLYNQFMEMPVDFLSKMRHFQPQVGCPNACSFCSKFSSNNIFYMNERTLKNVIAALKYSAMNYRGEAPYIVWDRNEHRNGVIFPYLDNDIGNYPYLDKYIDLLYDELGVQTRISTVTYSRHNVVLNKMHEKINSLNTLDKISGVRISLAPFGRAWEECQSNEYSLDEYCKDLSNFLKIYRPYYEKKGSGSREMCIELRYKPLIVTETFYEFDIFNHKCIIVGNYLFISKDKNIKFEISHTINPLTSSLDIDNEPIQFKQYSLEYKCINIEEAMVYAKKYINGGYNYRMSEVYLFENKEGIYYAIDPKIKDNGNYGINLFPLTESRKNSGYIITERFFLNALYSVKKKYNLTLSENFKSATWKDVDNVIGALHKFVSDYTADNKYDKANYIQNEVIPLITIYATALRKAKYEPNLFFDKHFTIDTGIICNLGRAINIFKDLTSLTNQPMTPTHEKNYGQYSSKMKIENYAWRLSCFNRNNLIIEKLNLFNTSSEEGQFSFKKLINLKYSSFVDGSTFHKPNEVVPGGKK